MSTAEPQSSTAQPLPRTALDFNLPKGEQFMINARGQRLQVRTFIPPVADDIKAIIFWNHGYAAHVNGPTLATLANGLKEHGFAVIAMDQHGHGYSDGERVLIKKYEHLVEDSMALVDIVGNGKPDGETRHLGLDDGTRQRLVKLPFFLAGQSMGGGLSLLIGMMLKENEALVSVAPRFGGVMVNCPAIVGNLPPYAVVLLLKYLVAPLFPSTQLPTFLEKVSVPELVWTQDEHMAMGLMDKIGKPGGLGWPGTMRIGTGAQLLEMISVIESRLPEIDFPFLVLHDPNDGVVKFEGTQKLLKEASTPADLFRGREVHEMLNMKHDLLSNVTPKVLAAYVDWATSRLQTLNAETS